MTTTRSESDYRRQLYEKGRIASGDFFRCLECGVALRALGTHLARRHDGMTRQQYVEKHRIPLGTPTIAPKLHEQLQEAYKSSPASGIFLKFARSPEHIDDLRKTAKQRGERHREIRKARPTSAAQQQQMNSFIKWQPLAVERRLENLAAQRGKKHCKHCGVEFETKPSSQKKFCSPKCFYACRVGGQVVAGVTQ
jgi:hypothetical protein